MRVLAAVCMLFARCYQSGMETIESVTARASAGDASAQYRLAARLAKAGKADEAAGWLDKAVAAGHPGAIYTRAGELISGRPDGAAAERAVAMLSGAAAKGGHGAARLLAVLKAIGLGAAEDWNGAVNLLAGAAAGGHPAAMRELAALALVGGGAAQEAARLLNAAASKGDWTAAVVGLRLGGVFTESESAALLPRLHAGRAPLLAGFGPVARAAIPAPSGIEIETLAKVAMAQRERAPARRLLNEAQPRIEAFKGALSAFECDYLICASAPLLTPSAVVDHEQGAAKQEIYRTSDGAAIGIVDLDLALFALWKKLAALAGAPAANAELLGLLRYRPGQEYKPHHDFLPEDDKDYSEVRRTGQRSHTLLVALNDGYEGGETHFPKLGVSWRGERGEALHFENTDAKGAPIRDSLHAGAPVRAGEKWLLSLWLREKRFWLW